MRRMSWSEAERILCVRLDTIGDVLMTTPAIRAVKESHPYRHITLLTSPSGAESASLVPEIDQVLVYDAPWMKATAPRRDARPEQAMIKRLRRMKFDGAIIFTVYSQNPLPTAFMCYMAEIPLRLAHCHENPYQLLTDWIKDPEPAEQIRHEVRRQLDLVARVGYHTGKEDLSLRVPVGASGRAVNALLKAGVNLHEPWVVLHAGATAPSRRYPPEGFARVARFLTHTMGYQVVFTGTSPERETIEEIRAAMESPSFSLVDELNLGDLAALLALTPLLLSNNTGPVHVAAAVGTPVVDLYALTNPQHTPWNVPHRVLNHDVDCKYCYKSVCPEGHHNCLRLVTPESILRAMHALLDEVSTCRRVEGGGL